MTNLSLRWMTLRLLLALCPVYCVCAALQEGQPNVCQQTVMVPRTERMTEMQVRVYYTMEWCVKIPPRCRRRRTHLEVGYKNVTRQVMETVNRCCDGYSRVAQRCVAVCSKSCVHGHCMPHDECACHSGWQGPSCSKAVCEPECHRAVCIAPNLCACHAGWAGLNCSQTVSGDAPAVLASSSAAVVGAGAGVAPRVSTLTALLVGGAALITLTLLCLILLIYYRRRYRRLKLKVQCGPVLYLEGDSRENRVYLNPPIGVTDQPNTASATRPCIDTPDASCEKRTVAENCGDATVDPRFPRAVDNIYHSIPFDDSDSDCYEEIGEAGVIGEKLSKAAKLSNDSKPAAARESQSEVEDNDYEDLSDDDHLYDMPKTAEVDAEEEHIYENSP